MDLNMVGGYGEFLDQVIAGNDPPLLSYRRPEFQDLEQWRGQARAKALELVCLSECGGVPEVEVVGRATVEGVEVERLRWQLPYGPSTEAVFLKPAGEKGPLPGILALHDHGGLKYFGWRKIADDGGPVHPILRRHRDEDYGGKAWANEVAKRGYAVLCHDTWPFGSRRVLVSDVPESIRWEGARDVTEVEERADIIAYNEWAGKHEGIWAKSLCSAGLTWPGMYAAEDMRALDVLAARPEVDASRLGCCGLSGGGVRSLYLSGLDERIGVGICAGMMTTWRDCSMWKGWTHTWMMWTPHLARFLDYPEIMGLRVPKPTMVLNNLQDPLFSLPEMRRADEMLGEVYEKAGASERYLCQFYAGTHKLDLEMQQDAFAWFDKWLRG